MRYAGNFLGGGGGLGRLVTTAEGIRALGPVGAIAALPGAALKSLSNVMTARNIGRLNEMIRSDSPLGRKMAATVETIPYDMLAEFGHNYNPFLISAFLWQQVFDADAPDYADAYNLMLILLDELRSIDLDHPDTEKAIEEIKVAFDSTGRPNPHAPSDR